MSRSSASAAIATLGIDLGKNSFHLIGQDERGAIVLRIKLSRSQLTQRLANIPPCLIGMETCAGAHYIGRQLRALGHDVRLIPAQYVKPFLKGHKNDYRDAEGIVEAPSSVNGSHPTLNHCLKGSSANLVDEGRAPSVRTVFATPRPVICPTDSSS
jgi:hypothetical protein